MFIFNFVGDKTEGVMDVVKMYALLSGNCVFLSVYRYLMFV